MRHLCPALLCLLLATACLAEEESPLCVFEFPEAPALGTVKDMHGNERPIRLGGHSGLTFRGRDGELLYFVTHPDRGPNSEPTDLLPDVEGKERPFPLPNFSPGLIEFTFNLATGEIERGHAEQLTRDKKGARKRRPFSGRPNLQAGAPKTPHTDDDPMGADLEGIELDGRYGHYWLCDEYRPSIYYVTPQGRLYTRWVPKGTSAAAGVELEGTDWGPYGREILPAHYAERRQNRGFEAITLREDRGRYYLYAFLQSPLVQGSQVSRVLEIDVTDIEAPLVRGEYLYPLEEAAQKVEKIGDATWLGGTRLAVVEQNSELGPEGRRYVTEIDLAGASNVLVERGSLPDGTRFEDHDLEALAGFGIRVLAKKRLFDLVELGLEADKVEGLAVVPGEKGRKPLLFLVNDDDFGLLDEEIPGDGRQPFLPKRPPSVLGVLELD
jgi:3-phytase